TDDDRKEYLSLLKEQADKANLQITGYCLMNNHVHLLAIPSSEQRGAFFLVLWMSSISWQQLDMWREIP
ncbi:MAG: hypothetical protein GY786_12230, partial [Proteobacteria bacterium]|nr:hypothetical protein [Pseudomonadota bacterium]